MKKIIAALTLSVLLCACILPAYAASNKGADKSDVSFDTLLSDLSVSAAMIFFTGHTSVHSAFPAL